MSGVITHGALGDGIDLSGATATFTLVDDPAQDVAGFVFSFWGVPIVPCDPVFAFVALDEGNITVHAGAEAGTAVRTRPSGGQRLRHTYWASIRDAL